MTVVAYILILTLLAYGLFFAYDVASVRSPQLSHGYLIFAAGILLNTAAAVLLFVDQLPGCPWDAAAFIALACSAVCLGLMVWALFFALPKDTYADPQKGRPVYDQGMYAICRHPGVLWYCGMFLFAAVAFRTMDAAVSCIILCAGNIAYMTFQDLWSFPRIFSGYREYRAKVPFFFPTPSSIRRGFASASPGGEGL